MTNKSAVIALTEGSKDAVSDPGLSPQATGAKDWLRTWLESCVPCLLFSLYVWLVCARLPNVIHQGRFWAEEGRVFYLQAIQMPWYQALFHSYYGYTNLAANLAGVLAYHLVPLKAAPYVSTTVAIVFQSVPAMILCLSGQDWLKNKLVLSGALLMLLVVPESQEIWMSSLGSQVFLTVGVGLILGLQTEPALAKRIFYHLVLILGPLSGPGSAFIWPFFIAKTVIEKSRARAWQCASLTIGVCAQLGLFYQQSERTLTFDAPLYFNVVYVKHLLVPFAGRFESNELCVQLHNLAVSGHLPEWTALAVISVACTLVAASVTCPKREALWFALMGVTVSVMSFLGALALCKMPMLDLESGNRYTYASQIFFEMSLMLIACTAQFRWIRVTALIAFAWLLVVGAHEYFYSSPMFAQGPSWRSEVRLWQADPNHALKLWPQGWELKLAPDAIKRVW
jgi:hypothetical protein